MSDLIAGSPTRRQIDILWLQQWFKYWPVELRESWIWGTNPHDIGGARSRIIHLAKHGGDFSGRHYEMLSPGGMMIQQDTDVIAHMPYPELMKILKQDFNDGWGMVCAPTAAMVGTKGMAQFAPKGEMFQDRPFEVTLAGFGLVAMSQQVIYELAPYDHREGMDGHTIPIYCSWNSHTGEDKDLIDRVARDRPRLHRPTHHHKTAKGHVVFRGRGKEAVRRWCRKCQSYFEPNTHHHEDGKPITINPDELRSQAEEARRVL